MLYSTFLSNGDNKVAHVSETLRFFLVCPLTIEGDMRWKSAAIVRGRGDRGGLSAVQEKGVTCLLTVSHRAM